MHKEQLFTVPEGVVVLEDKDAVQPRGYHTHLRLNFHPLVVVVVAAVQHSARVERYQMQDIREAQVRVVDILRVAEEEVVEAVNKHWLEALGEVRMEGGKLLSRVVQVVERVKPFHIPVDIPHFIKDLILSTI